MQNQQLKQHAIYRSALLIFIVHEKYPHPYLFTRDASILIFINYDLVCFVRLLEEAEGWKIAIDAAHFWKNQRVKSLNYRTVSDGN